MDKLSTFLVVGHKVDFHWKYMNVPIAYQRTSANIEMNNGH